MEVSPTPYPTISIAWGEERNREVMRRVGSVKAVERSEVKRFTRVCVSLRTLVRWGGMSR